MKNLNSYKIILLLLLTLTLNGCFEDRSVQPQKSSSEKLLIDLSGRWRFSLGDKMKWKEKSFNDNSWEKIMVPSSWENQGFHGYDGYAWYRTSFKLSKANETKDLYLILGYVDDVDQTFINGNLIGVSGGFPNNYRTAYNAFRKYYIPKEYLSKDGENVIAVRVYDDELDGGIISGNIGIYFVEPGFEPDINLSGIWDFKTDDDSSFIKNDKVDSNTVKLMVPAHWDIQGYEYYDGFAWYKKSFFLPKELAGESMILMLGKIDDIDQTFVNGILVGSTGLWNFKNVPTDFNSNFEWTQERIYSVPAKLLKFGETNTIAVRVYDGYKDGGIYEGPIGLITQSNYKKYFGKK
ncbi:MAG TPA: beta galactosidase jelly roll domain-containing protein [Ignavibacteriaceae bacterium]|nr:beta galactosidase jelly roll domain-containing protein [Ignavibacteriaceae bacterium]HRP92725.1 beta galactosidase jelly roll domain-containing protein [Ignavibacteriaceae bacterium]HRQ55338.1 beta galactosidase jelly roll domain-containing protein [Ignavibacteriaceae bacterium]